MQRTSEGYMRPQWNNTDSHGPILVKNSLSDGPIMKESTLFKKQLGWTVEILLDDNAMWQYFTSSNCILLLITVKNLYYKQEHRPMVKGSMVVVRTLLFWLLIIILRLLRIMKSFWTTDELFSSSDVCDWSWRRITSFHVP